MSYVIKGILNHRLPWTLVLFGVMLTVMLELAGVPSLAFAGGAVRWITDAYQRRKHSGGTLTSDEIAAEAERSNGTLLASGLIAGGALAGIINAFMSGVLAPGGSLPVLRSHAWSTSPSSAASTSAATRN